MTKKAVRAAFRETVFRRDHNTCRFCDCREDLDAHHIVDRNDMPNGGYVRENGITLCPMHHEMAEAFHRSGGQEWPDGFHPDDLYAKIGSSRERAYEASTRLSR